MSASVEFRVDTGDITSVRADMVALKYAQGFHGAAKAVAAALSRQGIDPQTLACALGEEKSVETRGAIAARNVLFVGVPGLSRFGYPEIRGLISQTLAHLRRAAPDVGSLAMTAHGANTGLDPLVAFMTQADVCREAVSTGVVPEQLTTIIVVERDARRTAQFRTILIEKWRGLNLDPLPGGLGFRLPTVGRKETWSEQDLALAQDQISRMVPQAEQLASAFVAMPFSPAPHMQDLYELGIVPAVSKAGFRATRIDHETFTGDIVAEIKAQISQSRVAIANLTDNNPNVYLEVGYAWASDVPTVLLVDDASKLMFNVKSSKCLVYKGGILELQKMLSAELLGLIAKGIIKP